VVSDYLQPELNLPQLSSTPSIGNIKLAKYGKVSEAM